MIDQPSTDISRYFYIASKFIENGINSGGKWLHQGRPMEGASDVRKLTSMPASRQSVGTLHDGYVPVGNLCPGVFDDRPQDDGRRSGADCADAP